MLKAISCLLVLVSCCNYSFAQSLNGTYTSGQEYFRFSNDSVSFYVKQGSCIIYELAGSGKYTLSGRKLQINPFVQEKPGKVITVGRQSKDTLQILIHAEDHAAPVYATALFYLGKDKVAGQISGGDNKVYLKQSFLDKIDSVQISCITYSIVSFKLDKQKDYDVTLVKSERKDYYDYMLQQEDKGWKIRVNKSYIELRREYYSCKRKKYRWQKFIKQSASGQGLSILKAPLVSL